MAIADAIVISDLHLGSENCEAKALVAFLESIRAGRIPAARIILNGDVFDSIDFRRLKKHHWKVLSTLRKISDEVPVVWVCGNHDGSAEIVSHLLGVEVVDEYTVESEGGKVMFLHGHQFDKFISKYPVATWIADRFYRLLQKLDRSHYFAKLAKRRSKIFLRSTETIRAGAIAYGASHGADVVCCGHTHRAIEDHSGEVAYFNSGCWTERPCHYLRVGEGKVELCAYTPEWMAEGVPTEMAYA